MKILNLTQGTDEWLKVRKEHFTASDASAMMNASKYKTRNQLLREKKGWAEPIDSSKQALFDKGHKAEDLARGILEINMLEEFPAIVGSLEIEGLKLLASLDGFAADENLIFEHKLFNATLAENVKNGVLEESHYWQLEHQCLVFNVLDVIFVVSDGTSDNWVEMIYHAVPERRAQLIAGWKQFKIDLDAFVLEAKKEVVVAQEQESFPVVECRVEGSVVVSNLGQYIPVIKKLAEEQMSVILETDQDFINKDAFNKNVKEGRANLKAKASDIEKQFESLAEFNGHVADADKILQKLQAHGEKQVKESKQNKKDAISLAGEKQIIALSNECNAKISPMTLQAVASHLSMPDFDAAMKGKRTIESFENAVSSEVAKAKIEIAQIMALVVPNIEFLRANAEKHRFLFADAQALVNQPEESFQAIVKLRIAEHEKAEVERLELERENMRKEEEAKAKAKVEAEAKAKSDAEAKKEADRLAEEKQRLRDVDAQNERYKAEQADQAMAEQAHNSLGGEIPAPVQAEVQKAPVEQESAPLARNVYMLRNMEEGDMIQHYEKKGFSTNQAQIIARDLVDGLVPHMAFNASTRSQVA